VKQQAASIRAAIVALVLASQLVNGLAPAIASAQGSPTSNVQRGQEYYEQSRFDEAISLLKDLVDRGALAGEDLQHARELLARSYVKKGYPVQGKEMFKSILRVNPTWRPDPIRVPPDETAVFEQALKEFTAETVGAAPPTPAGAETPATAPATPPTAAPAPPKPEPTPATEIVPSAGAPQKKKSNKMVWYIAGGAVVLGGIVAAAAGGGGKKSSAPPVPLAGFPGPPTP
jgi:hypothetical protein